MNADRISTGFKEVMAAFTSAITIVTTKNNQSRFGLIATSVCSLSAEPPSLLVCVNKSAAAHDQILQAGRFAVNVLGHHQENVAQEFMSLKGEDRFSQQFWTESESGLPILMTAASSVECRTLALHDGLSHTIFVGEITEFKLSPESDVECLLWNKRAFSSLAPVMRHDLNG